MTHYALTDAWLFMSHGGQWVHSDGAMRSAGPDFLRCALSGWKKAFSPLAAFLQSPPRRLKDLMFAGRWQPLGVGKKSQEINDVDWADMSAWFSVRAAYAARESGGIPETMVRSQAKLTFYKSMIKPSDHPHYIKVTAGDDVGKISHALMKCIESSQTHVDFYPTSFLL